MWLRQSLLREHWLLPDRLSPRGPRAMAVNRMPRLTSTAEA